MKSRTLPWIALIACAVLGLTACDAGSPGAAADNTPAATPSPTVLTPRNVPVGWQVYHGPHFALAYPDGWKIGVFPQGNSTPTQPSTVYSFTSPTDPWESVTVLESDGMDAATIQEICASGASQRVVTLAGLPMRYDDTGVHGMVRGWAFITDRGTVYQLQTNDGPNAPTPPASAKADVAAVLATFTPEYTTPGCK